MPSAMPFTGRPRTSTSPSLGASRPEIRPSVVDLPQPVGPTTAQNSPGSTIRSRSRSAVYAVPEGVRKRLVTFRSWIAGAIQASLRPPVQAFNGCGLCDRFGRFGLGRGLSAALLSSSPVKTRLPLAYQILIFQAAIILVSALIGSAAAVWHERQALDRQYEQRALVIAESVASNDDVAELLVAGDPERRIQRLAESVRQRTGALYVVVTDRNGIRYSHPNPDETGRQVGTPIPPEVLAGGTWVGIQEGSLGLSARGKAPIMRN